MLSGEKMEFSYNSVNGSNQHMSRDAFYPRLQSRGPDMISELEVSKQEPTRLKRCRRDFLHDKDGECIQTQTELRRSSNPCVYFCLTLCGADGFVVLYRSHVRMWNCAS